MQVRKRLFIALAGLGTGLGSSAGIAQGQPLQLIRVANIPTISYLGIATKDVNAEMAKALKLPEVAGGWVTKMDPASPAALAGIKLGDVVMQYNGQRVENWEQFARMVRETPAGRDVTLQIYRNGVPQTIKAKIVLHPATTFDGVLVPLQPHAPPFQSVSQDVPVPRMSWVSSPLGAELESLDGQLADAFGVKDGVLVRSVTRGLAADRAGLKAGDVITHVGDARVATAMDVSGRIRAGRGQSAVLTVWREHHEISLSIALDGGRPGEQ
jgi:serine protease Do